METWKQGKTYDPGTVVLHKGEVYQKDNDADQTEPDPVAGGWSHLPNTNVVEYQAIEASFNSYEADKAKYQAQVLAKLQAEGLNPDAVKAVLNA